VLAFRGLRPAPRFSIRSSLPVGLLAWLVAGCSGGAGGDSCPSVPDSCPDAGAPTFSGDVAPIVQARCMSCHSPGGQDAVLPLTSYDQIAAAVIGNGLGVQIATCRMPLPPASMNGAERQAILQWIACHTPND
jgi:hypothetical protein